MVAQYDVIVVGGGILGASTAYHLEHLRAGRILLLDRDRPAGGATGKSAAIVHQHFDHAPTVRLARATIDMLKAMPDERDTDSCFVQCGHGLMVGADMLVETRKTMAVQRSLGIDVAQLAGGGPPHLIGPIDSRGVAALIYEKLGGYADPVKTTEIYVKAFRNAGGTVKPGTTVRALRREGDRITGVETDQGPLSADLVVNAAGPWAGLVAATASLPLSLTTSREHVSHWRIGPDHGPPIKPVPRIVITDLVAGIYLRPLGIAHIAVGRAGPRELEPADPERFRRGPNPTILEDMRQRIARRFPELSDMPLASIHTALGATTEDGLAYAGRRGGLAGYADACSGAYGFAVAPALGRELARALVSNKTTDDLASLSYDRLAGKQQTAIKRAE